MQGKITCFDLKIGESCINPMCVISFQWIRESYAISSPFNPARTTYHDDGQVIWGFGFGGIRLISSSSSSVFSALFPSILISKNLEYSI